LSDTGGDSTPNRVYALALVDAAAEAARWTKLERRLSQLRLLAFGAGVVTAWLVFGTRAWPGVAIWPFVIAFAALVVVHDRVIARRRRAERVVAHFEGGLARLEERWVGHGQAGERFRDPAHPYADDLDLFGEGSLFELLCTAQTAAGQDALARWLLEPSPAQAALARQQAVRELAPRVELRRDLALLGEDVGDGVSTGVLADWAQAPRRLDAAALPVIAGALTLASLGALGLWIFSDAGAVPFLFMLALQGAFAALVRPRVRPVLAGAEAPTRHLSILTHLLARFEAEEMQAAHLRALKSRLDTSGRPPSHEIARLRRLVDLMEARHNQLFAPVGALLLWGSQIAFALERWRSRCGAALGPWVESAGELEALCALSGYAYEHPDDVWPDVVEGPAAFEGRALGHPLLARESCVRNDLALAAEGEAPHVLMMSGSNMSGKSTMLRTVGCNLVLALAGAPVRAERLRVSPLQLAASIRISDSLQTGTSHFYAEIKRLRQVVELTEGERTVLFLLDEVLHGTNSHDRRIGAEAVVRGLIDRGALGIVTTHDLALARLADDLAPLLQNVHFEDQIEGGQMRFDYQLRPGVVTRSNALELMRSVGLEV
jgi:hypothetical protein